MTEPNLFAVLLNDNDDGVDVWFYKGAASCQAGLSVDQAESLRDALDEALRRVETIRRDRMYGLG